MFFSDTVYIAWRPSATSVMLALIVAFETAFG